MRTWVIIGLMAALFTACGASQTPLPSTARNESCQATDLKEVFRRPLSYDGKLFCGEAVLVSERFVALYPRIPQTNEEKYGTVLLPKGAVSDIAKLVKIGTGKTLRIRGRLNVDRDCLSGQSLCTPIKRPIALEDFSFEESR